MDRIGFCAQLGLEVDEGLVGCWGQLSVLIDARLDPDEFCQKASNLRIDFALVNNHAYKSIHFLSDSFLLLCDMRIFICNSLVLVHDIKYYFVCVFFQKVMSLLHLFQMSLIYEFLLGLKMTKLLLRA